MVDMNHILFLNAWEGLGFLLKKKMEAHNVTMEYFDSKNNPKEFKKYNIKTTPVLVVLDKKEEAYRLTSTDEIVEYLKNVQNTEIPT